MFPHVITNGLQRQAIDTADKMGAMPKQKLPKERGEMVGKTFSCTSGTGRFNVDDQHRNIKSWMEVYYANLVTLKILPVKMPRPR